MKIKRKINAILLSSLLLSSSISINAAEYHDPVENGDSGIKIFSTYAQGYAEQYFNNMSNDGYIVHCKGGGYFWKPNMDKNYEVGTDEKLMTIKQAKKKVKKEYLDSIEKLGVQEYINQYFKDLNDDDLIISYTKGGYMYSDTLTENYEIKNGETIITVKEAKEKIEEDFAKKFD